MVSHEFLYDRFDPNAEPFGLRRHGEKAKTAFDTDSAAEKGCQARGPTSDPMEHAAEGLLTMVKILNFC